MVGGAALGARRPQPRCVRPPFRISPVAYTYTYTYMYTYYTYSCTYTHAYSYVYTYTYVYTYKYNSTTFKLTPLAKRSPQNRTRAFESERSPPSRRQRLPDPNPLRGSKQLFQILGAQLPCGCREKGCACRHAVHPDPRYIMHVVHDIIHHPCNIQDDVCRHSVMHTGTLLCGLPAPVYMCHSAVGNDNPRAVARGPA